MAVTWRCPTADTLPGLVGHRRTVRQEV